MIEKFDKLKDSDVHVSPPHSATFKTAVVGAYLSSFLFEKNSSEQALILLAIPWGHSSWVRRRGAPAVPCPLAPMDGWTDGWTEQSLATGFVLAAGHLDDFRSLVVKAHCGKPLEPPPRIFPFSLLLWVWLWFTFCFFPLCGFLLLC